MRRNGDRERNCWNDAKGDVLTFRFLNMKYFGAPLKVSTSTPLAAACLITGMISSLDVDNDFYTGYRAMADAIDLSLLRGRAEGAKTRSDHIH